MNNGQPNSSYEENDISQAICCRFCHSDRTIRFLDLGEMPPANDFIAPAQASTDQERKYNLDLHFCSSCGLVQLGQIVPPETIFKDYIYFSGTSDAVHQHGKYLLDKFQKSIALKSESLIVEIASNDGTILRYLKETGAKIIGVEPAENVALEANSQGLHTINTFFNSKTSEEIRAAHGQATLILARNVFAHVPEIHDFTQGMKHLLAQEGIIAIEAPYLVDLLEKNEFDTIYHEHYSYLSVRPMINLMKLHSLEVFDLESTDMHGGSLIYYIGHSNQHPISKRVAEYIAIERKNNLENIETYNSFAARVMTIKADLINLLKSLKEEGKRLVGYGASAKGNTLLNFCGVGTELLDYIVDKSPHKHNLLTPGMHIPIFPVEKLIADVPDYTLILAWNFSKEIIQQQDAYLKKGGKFILPIPKVKIL